MEKAEIRDLVIAIIKEKGHGIKMPANFDSNESLFLSGVIDSFGLFAFIANVQKKFNLNIEDREIHPGNFETIENITSFIYNKKNVT